MFIIWACVWLLLLWSSGHVRVYALRESKPCLPISAGLRAASIMHEDQYAVAFWARPCDSVPISSIACQLPCLWRELCRWIYLCSRESRLQSGYPKLLLFGGKENHNQNKAGRTVFEVFLTLTVLWQYLMKMFKEALQRSALRGDFSCNKKPYIVIIFCLTLRYTFLKWIYKCRQWRCWC